MVTTVNPVKEIKPMGVPSQWAAIGAEVGYRPLPATALRQFILGPHGGGKTTFVAGIPRALILDFECGSWGVPLPKATRLEVVNHETLERALNILDAEAKSSSRPFDRVIFDTVDQWSELMNSVLAAEKGVADITAYGGKGHGWSMLRHACWDIVKRIEKAGYAWTVVGHLTEKTITVNEKERTVTRPVIFDTFAKQVSRNADLIGSVSAVVEQEQVTQEYKGRQIPAGTKDVRKVYLDVADTGTALGNLETKKRGVPTLRDRIELPPCMDGHSGWDYFVKAYNEAVEQVKSRVNKGSVA
jgi:hypothetical protein